MPDKPLVVKPSSKAKTFVYSYANNVQFELNSWDIALFFGDVVRTETETEIEVRSEQHTAIRLSWPQAKVAAILFALNVANQEEKFGAIAIPTNVISQYVADADTHLPLIELAKKIINDFENSPATATDQ